MLYCMSFLLYQMQRRQSCEPEVTTHISIHTLHLDGLRELYRHFLRLDNGAIVEVNMYKLNVAFTLELLVLHTLTLIVVRSGSLRMSLNSMHVYYCPCRYLVTSLVFLG